MGHLFFLGEGGAPLLRTTRSSKGKPPFRVASRKRASGLLPVSSRRWRTMADRELSLGVETKKKPSTNRTQHKHLESPSDPFKMFGCYPKWGHGPNFYRLMETLGISFVLLFLLPVAPRTCGQEKRKAAPPIQCPLQKTQAHLYPNKRHTSPSPAKEQAR